MLLLILLRADDRMLLADVSEPLSLALDPSIVMNPPTPEPASTQATLPRPTVPPEHAVRAGFVIDGGAEVVWIDVTPEPQPETAKIVFEDQTGQGEPEALSPPADPVQTPEKTQAPLPTLEPKTSFVPGPSPVPKKSDKTWTYDQDGVVVTIDRYRQDGFVYFAADIQLSRPDQLSYAFSHNKFGAATEHLSDIAQRYDPVVAINGDYYSFNNNGVIIRGGKLYRKQNSKRQLLIVDAEGDLRALTDRREKQGLVADMLMKEHVLHTFEFGPLLVKDGKAVTMNTSLVRTDEGVLEPRTALGQLGPLHYLAIVVDGRSKGYSDGCDLPTLQRLFLDHGASFAFNLDGGGSTTLWFDGKVINKPAAGEERKVSDIVMFMR